MNTTNHWAHDAVFYHIYPLGFCGAPARNDFTNPPVPRLDKILTWLTHLQGLGINALYLGPVFESSAHGYDTADYYQVDRRLGTRQTLKDLSAELHNRGIRLILDGVFNHVGRDFWAFRDVQQYGQDSLYKDWFDGLRFDGRSSYGDPFTYNPWNGNNDLVRLNQSHPHVRAHLFDAVRMWVEEFNIDGLRLDVADCLDFDFMHALRSFTGSLRPDFWLLGEVVHGDYRRWVNPQMLHSVTNYEVYKGLYSSLVDKNYFEIAYALNRQFADGGIYAGLPLYNFADNHDVDRVASKLNNPNQLPLLYLLLFTMPGVPSIYYGSEWGITGQRTPFSDAPVRPDLDLPDLQQHPPQAQLSHDIARLAALRQSLPALRHGSYAQLSVAAQQFAFSRATGHETLVVVLNTSMDAVPLAVQVPHHFSHAVDLLNCDEVFKIHDGSLQVEAAPAQWGRVLRLD